MKSTRSKKTVNSSFLSNHDLLQNFRNKSFKLITRESSLNDFKQMPKKVSLIQKKNYDSKSKQNNKQNEPLLSNRKALNLSKQNTCRQKTKQQKSLCMDHEIQKIVKQLNFVYDSINSEQIELRMILNRNIRKVKEVFYNMNEIKKPVQTIQDENDYKEKLQFLNNKVEQQSKKTFKYKKQCEELKDKISLYEKKISNLEIKLQEEVNMNRKFTREKQQEKTMMSMKSQAMIESFSQNLIPIQLKRQFTFKQHQKDDTKPNPVKSQNQQNQIQILQNIIQTQQQLISKQQLDFQAQNQEFLRILKVQALQIQQFLDKNQCNQNMSINEKYKVPEYTTTHTTRQQSKNKFSYHTVNSFSNMSSPQKMDIFTNRSKKKPLKNEMSICLF